MEWCGGGGARKETLEAEYKFYINRWEKRLLVALFLTLYSLMVGWLLTMLLCGIYTQHLSDGWSVESGCND